jgi:hypothetical protein
VHSEMSVHQCTSGPAPLAGSQDGKSSKSDVSVSATCWLDARSLHITTDALVRSGRGAEERPAQQPSQPIG